MALLCFALVSCAGERTETGASNQPAATATAAEPRVLPVDAAQLVAEVKRSGARATLVNVWATWCAPCVREMPELLQLEQTYRDKGLRVMLVSADFDSAAPGVFLGKRGVRFDSWIKTGGDQEFIEALEPRWSGALPVTVVFDAQGRAVRYWEGAADYARFEEAVLAVLNPNASPTTHTGGTR